MFISPYFCSIGKYYHLSLLKRIFPDKLKIAKIIPIFKAEDVQSLGRICRKTRYTLPLSVWISENHSTSQALIYLVNKIASAIDQHETTVGVFLDLSKAFDTLDHHILFAKLEHYGIRDVALQWFKSYFSCRQQFAQFNQACSPMQTIKCGVPQGAD